MTMRFRIATALAALVAAAAAGPAAAQRAPIAFDGAHYGKDDLPIQESTGSSTALVQLLQGAFEPVHELRPDDPLRILSTPIGRLDYLVEDSKGKRVAEVCTAALLAGDLVLTNAHCVPSDTDRSVKAVSILMNYMTAGVKGDRFEVGIKPLEINKALDYAIMKAEGNPTRKHGFVRLQMGGASPGESLLIFGHPLGRPKMMTRFRCFAHKNQPDGAEFRHRCDTLPGNSGSLVFTASHRTVALHYLGGLDPKDETSFNTASRLAHIHLASPLLKQVLAAQGGTPAASAPPVAAPPAPTPAPAAPTPTAAITTEKPAASPALGLNEGEIKDVLRGK